MMGQELFFGASQNQYSINFDGVNDYVTAGNTSSFNYLHGALNTTAFQFTISFWVKLPNPNANTSNVVFDNTTGTSAQTGLYFSIDSRTVFSRVRAINIAITRSVAGQSVIASVSANGVYPNTTGWVNVVWTYDQALATNNSKVYIDGSLAFQATKTGNTPSTGNASNVLNIARLSNNTLITACKLYSLFFANIAINQTQVNEIIAASRKKANTYTFGANVTNDYRFPNGQADYPNWIDAVGGINGTMTNQSSANITTDIP